MVSRLISFGLGVQLLLEIMLKSFPCLFVLFLYVNFKALWFSSNCIADYNSCFSAGCCKKRYWRMEKGCKSVWRGYPIREWGD